MEHIKKSSAKIFGFFSLALFLGFLGSTLFFNHTHMSDGRIIAHSHPFKPEIDGKPIHGHTDESFVHINLLSAFSAIIAISFSLVSALLFLSAELLPKKMSCFFPEEDELQMLLRGPPQIYLS